MDRDIIKAIHYLEEKRKEFGSRDNEYWEVANVLKLVKELEALKNGYTTNCEDVAKDIVERFNEFKASLKGQGSVQEIIDNIKLVSVLKNQREDDSIYYEIKVSIQGFHTVTELIEETKIGILERVMFEVTGGVSRMLNIQEMCLKKVDEVWRAEHNRRVEVWRKEQKQDG